MTIFTLYLSNFRQMKGINSIFYMRNTLKLIKKNHNNKYSILKCNYSTKEKSGKNVGFKNNTVPFLDMVKGRKSEAKRSIVVQVQSPNSFKELNTYCSSLGTVTNMIHYSTGVEPLHFIIVEFATEKEVKNILSESSHLNEHQGVPTYSQFLWFRAANRKLNKLKQSKTAQLLVENGTAIMKDSEIKDILRECKDVSEQMRVLHERTKLNDTGVRLRFLTTRQVETAVSGMFPYAAAYPFGSSVNGYGKMGCDLDLVLQLSERAENNLSRLIFHCKASSGSERSTAQRHMEALGDLIHLFLPGCAQVRRILQARVPIIKFHHQLTDVECDLSMGSLSGVHMSDFLYLMGNIDERVRPLVFTIRKWAAEVDLTNSSPGRWITNFSLTLLVLAFLQKPLNSPAILPSLNSLSKLAGPKDKFTTDDGLNCSFLRDVSKLNHPQSNTESLESLLREFFEFYSQFDFHSKAICLNESVAFTKPEYSPIYIVNPLERGLNVSKNVSLEEVERFKVEVRNAAWLLESQEEKSNVGNWGLLSIFENKRNAINFSFNLSNKQRRLMEVSTLFEEGDGSKEMEYENENVKKQVENIKKETKQKLDALASSMKFNQR